MHSEIETLERIKILRDLRKGEYDVLIGINLLREGLDLPEVSLVAILDADKEGFLRSQGSLIQTIGRAARHLEGRAILYADSMTDSMKRAIDETDRRRAIQVAYNEEHGITPQCIIRPLSMSLAGISKPTTPTSRRSRRHSRLQDPGRTRHLHRQTGIRHARSRETIRIRKSRRLAGYRERVEDKRIFVWLMNCRIGHYEMRSYFSEDLCCDVLFFFLFAGFSAADVPVISDRRFSRSGCFNAPSTLPAISPLLSMNKVAGKASPSFQSERSSYGRAHQ